MKAIRYVAIAAIAFGSFSGPALLRLGPTVEAAAEDSQPSQVALTQAKIDDLLAAQKDLRAIQGNNDQDKPDPATLAKYDAAVKKHGFASADEYANVSYSIGLVMAGFDPETKSYVGPVDMIKKQIQEIQADGKMPPKEKKEALAELNQALKQGPSDKPSAANIDIVKANFDKLAQAMQQSE